METEQEAALQRLADALTDEDWVESCRKRRPTFPAVTTYLAQFMAHDMTFTAHDMLNFASTEPLKRKTANLRTIPLRLMTLYGENVRQSDNLFSIHGIGVKRPNIKFRLNSFHVHKSFGKKIAWAPDFSLPNFSETIGTASSGIFISSPRLADMRNADQPMILFVAVTFMRLHNYYVSQLTGISDQIEKFEIARLLVTKVWHDIIRNDILGHLAPAPDMSLLQGKKHVEDPDPVHGAMRALHALPLNNYRLHNRNDKTYLGVKSVVSKTLQDLKKSKAVTIEIKASGSQIDLTSGIQKWWEDWGVDLDDFIEAVDATEPFQNVTNVMPALPSALNLRGLFRQDLQSAGKLGVSSIHAYSGLRDAVIRLYGELGGGDFPHHTTVPLSISLLAEAYFANKANGGFGPIGAALFAQRIEKDLLAASVNPALQATSPEVARLLKGRPTTFAAILKKL